MQVVIVFKCAGAVACVSCSCACANINVKSKVTLSTTLLHMYSMVYVHPKLHNAMKLYPCMKD